MSKSCQRVNKMASGRKSNIINIVIPNESNYSEPYVAHIQGNKNYGICDITVGGQGRISKLLSIFQGRQFNDPNNLATIKDMLWNSLNAK